MREEVFSWAGAQEKVISGYEFSDMDDIEFFWENPQLEVGVVFKSRFHSPLPVKTFGCLEIRGFLENAIILDSEEDKRNSPYTTLVSERPNQPSQLL